MIASARYKQGIIFEIKVTLLETHPPIWRRFQIDDCSLSRLHHTIQIAMGWGNCHLHFFAIDDINYAEVDPMFGEDPDMEDAGKVTLTDLVMRPKDCPALFTYLYDFGDSWEHEVLIERMAEAEKGKKYPILIDGNRNCPPNDVGGVWGYQEFLEAIKDPNHEEHDELSKWIGGEFDPEDFDVEARNRLLADLREGQSLEF